MKLFDENNSDRDKKADLVFFNRLFGTDEWKARFMLPTSDGTGCVVEIREDALQIFAPGVSIKDGLKDKVMTAPITIRIEDREKLRKILRMILENMEEIE